MLNDFGGGMPHQIIEYSSNLNSVLDIATLVDALHSAAAAQEELPLAGLRTRAYVSERFLIADRHPDNAFVAVYLRVGEGRDRATLQRIGSTLSEVLVKQVQTMAPDLPIALSYELQEIDAGLRWNTNSIRDHMQAR